MGSWMCASVATARTGPRAAMLFGPSQVIVGRTLAVGRQARAGTTGRAKLSRRATMCVATGNRRRGGEGAVHGVGSRQIGGDASPASPAGARAWRGVAIDRGAAGIIDGARPGAARDAEGSPHPHRPRCKSLPVPILTHSRGIFPGGAGIDHPACGRVCGAAANLFQINEIGWWGWHFVCSTPPCRSAARCAEPCAGTDPQERGR